MSEGENTVDHLMKVHDLQEHLLNIDEVILDEKMISKTLHSLPPLYQMFYTSHTLSMRGYTMLLLFEELVNLLL